ncbi:uncharacterized protein (TIGR02391 family) [Bradyrhizobium sp. LA6.10]|uniref:TIGR02391 family protein n=1 Tax=Bradyrhizobium sp. LA6.10 TaxID=3156318 RepID=UPI0033913C9E
MTVRPRAKVSRKDIPAAVRKLERRLDELEEMRPIGGMDWFGDAGRIVASVNSTLDEVFGQGTADAFDFHVNLRWFTMVSGNESDRSQQFGKGIDRSRKAVADAIKRLNEWALDADEDASSRVIRAYEGLDLHPEIARAASELYANKHYANAIEDAVKALNAFVRLRSGVEDRDGIKLMEFVFSVKNPVLAFNDLRNDSDEDEQKGFMMMFSGAVAGLRNPRAHRLVQDDPERALEFIAFISLLAKLVDGAKRLPKA